MYMCVCIYIHTYIYTHILLSTIEIIKFSFYKYNKHFKTFLCVCVCLVINQCLSNKVLFYKNFGVGEITQGLRAVTALTEDPSSIPSTHMAAHIPL